MRMHLDRVFGALVGLTVLLTLVVVGCVAQVLHLYQEGVDAAQRRYQSYVLADELRQSSDDLTRLARTFVVSQDPKWEQQYFEILDIRNGKKPRPVNYAGIYWDLRAVGQTPNGGSTTSAVPLTDMMKTQGFTEREFALMQQAKANSDDLVRTETIAMNMVKGQFDDGHGGFTKKGLPDLEQARLMMHDLAYHQYKAKIMAPVNDFLSALDQRTAQEVEQLNIATQRWMIAGIVAACIEGVLLVGLILGVHRSIREALAKVRNAARAIANGDLSVVPDNAGPDDVLGQLNSAVIEMRDKLAQTIARIRDGAERIAHGSVEIAAGNASLSHRTETQASNLQQAASAMGQMNVTVKNSADTAREAAKLAESVSTAAENGGQLVGQVVSTMSEISSSSARIGDIISVIDGIAFQTNILALNAAVEAARAGEQGRGFAVVAAEVRSLAKRSAEAAKEIKTLISNSVDRVQDGTRLVGEAGQGMDDLVRQIKHVAQLITHISTATAEQADGIGTVNQSVSDLESVTQQNAALVEQSAAASDGLKEQARVLSEAVAAFKLQGA
ncbi:methyl-accepting chemotaxis protein [Roseateles sp. BYS180W]|uniref:Methyl-accepting chemotaxis protein n=1 Tax=Roseateles rivi TaxID=3299028 RepID=A0ABW7FTY0_9BURK